MDKWDRRFLKLAKEISTWSKDPSTQTGAVIVDKNNRIVSIGYNGFAKGIKDTKERLEKRELKYKLILHCEDNAILFAKQELVGCTLYTWPFMSCSRCASKVIQSGIETVVAPYSNNERWFDDFKLSATIFKEAGVLSKVYVNYSTQTTKDLLLEDNLTVDWETAYNRYIRGIAYHNIQFRKLVRSLK